jgi:hypothetical protein
MKLYVPEIGDHLRLTADWTFTLYNEYRNSSLWELYDCENHPVVAKKNAEKEQARNELNALENKMYPGNTYWQPRHSSTLDPADIARRTELRDIITKMLAVEVTIPTGSIVSVDRIFIRKGMDDWSSLTFYLKDHPDKTFKKKPRFWAKLADCNCIEFVQHSS